MRIISLIIKGIKQDLRDKRSMALMIALPIVLMVILGAALSGTTSNAGDNISVDAIYSIDGSGTNKETFIDFINGFEEMGNVNFTEVEDEIIATNLIKNLEYSCYIRFDSEKNILTLYKNDRYSLSASIAESIFRTYVQRYNVITEIVAFNPKVISEITNEEDITYTEVVSLNKKVKPRAIDYYGITMTTLIILYASLIAGFNMRKEDYMNTKSRLLISPISKSEIFIGKTVGTFLSSMAQVFVVVLFSKYVLGVNWGNNISIVVILILSELLMAISLGTGVGLLVSSEGALNGILQTIIPFMVFLGGGYLNIDMFNSELIYRISWISPVRWMNSTLFNVIYNSDISGVGITIGINICIAIFFLVLSSLLFRKENVK
ncbi:ABC transporter permease [Clostridium sp. DL1XJH146]